MKAKDLIAELEQVAPAPDKTCDTVKVVRAAKEWGADMLLVHEPTYYDHMEVFKETPVTCAKRALIEESGMVIYRYHDRMHATDPDMITDGELHYLGLQGKTEKTKYFASYLFTSDTPITARELAERMERDLNIAHVRIAGELDRGATRIAACFGTPGGVFELLCREDVEIVLTGEACEWRLAEYARDAAALGFNKTLIVMGHIGSERDGMRLLTERLQQRHADLAFRYFECGEVYQYR